ncbi:hypothetical protein FACS1894166_06900 [Bacilli bacterium]|nr:hypothetical protein FACS1894166_06900 [Bacilli bacterium]
MGIVMLLFSIAACFVQYQQQSHLFKVGLSNQNKNNGIAKEYVDYLKKSTNCVSQDKLSKDLQSNYSEFQRIYMHQNKFTACFDFVEAIFNSVTYIVLVLMCCYMMINNKQLNIGTMTLLISLSVMMSNSINAICGFAIKKIEYARMSEIYKNFIEIDNIKSEGILKIINVKTIIYKNKDHEVILHNGMNL